MIRQRVHNKQFYCILDMPDSDNVGIEKYYQSVKKSLNILQWAEEVLCHIILHGSSETGDRAVSNCFTPNLADKLGLSCAWLGLG